jgi:hypothetical protein
MTPCQRPNYRSLIRLGGLHASTRPKKNSRSLGPHEQSRCTHQEGIEPGVDDIDRITSDLARRLPRRRHIRSWHCVMSSVYRGSSPDIGSLGEGLTERTIIRPNKNNCHSPTGYKYVDARRQLIDDAISNIELTIFLCYRRTLAVYSGRFDNCSSSSFTMSRILFLAVGLCCVQLAIGT